MAPSVPPSTSSGGTNTVMSDLAKARLGCINPQVLAELLLLTPEQRAQLMQTLQSTPQLLRADGTLPVEVGLRLTTAIKNLSLRCS